MEIKKAAIVLNGFVHDFATGYWLSAMIVIKFLRDFQVQSPSLAELLQKIMMFFFWNSVAAVAVILATGAGRTYTYIDNVFGTETEATRRRILIIKHVILLALFGLGEFWAWCATFR